MTKREFLDELAAKLKHLPEEEREARVAFCGEMIDDRMEEGLSEAEAVEVICRDEGLAAPEDEAMPSPKKTKAWEKVLIIGGFPLWLSLLLAAVSVVLSLYVVLWAVVVSLWAAFGALVGCAFGGIAGGVGFAIGGFGTAGLAAVGAGLVLAGLSILLFYGCRAVTRGAVWITKRPFAKGKKKEVSA